MSLFSLFTLLGRQKESAKSQIHTDVHEAMNIKGFHIDEEDPWHVELKDTYDGEQSDKVLYVDITPSAELHISARFRDCIVPIKELKVLDAYDGIYEGMPNYIAMHVLESAIEEAKRDKLMSHKVIFPKWQRDSHWPLPPYKFEMLIQHYEEVENPEYEGQMNWYFLKLVWFDNAPASNQALEEYINAITSQLSFFQITRKLTEEEKDNWC